MTKEEIVQYEEELNNYIVSCNQGISDIGELSRIMLGIKTIMAQKDEIETLIFDEIDNGISGRTAADGLAVTRPSALVGRIIQPLLSGDITIQDKNLANSANNHYHPHHS